MRTFGDPIGRLACEVEKRDGVRWTAALEYSIADALRAIQERGNHA
jgi:hypothetical protein